MRPGHDTGPRLRKGEAWRGITRLGRDPDLIRGPKDGDTAPRAKPLT